MIFKTENESPRGRISLFKALAEEQIEASSTLITSLDHCLSCRACEKMCPSQVDYATISKLGRELIAAKVPHYKPALQQKLVEKLLVTQSLHPLLKFSVRAIAPLQSYLGKKLGQPLENHPSLAAAGNFSHEIAVDSSNSSPLQEYYPAGENAPRLTQKPTPQVILFKGCSSDLFEQHTLKDSITLLNACQFDVIIPDKQHCCGAINTRHGDIAGIKELAQQNIKQFESSLQNSRAIISITNSCSAHLKDYHKLTDICGAEDFSAKTADIISFLAHAVKTANIKFSPLSQQAEEAQDKTAVEVEVGVHIPCSLKNVLQEEQLLFDLLENIPGIRLIKINDQYCCGAAGSYMLQYPDIAKRLLEDKIEDVIKHNYQLIVSSNIGCSLHFKQGLRKHENKTGRTIEVIHPVRLLARQLIHS